MITGKRLPQSLRRGLHQLLRAPEAASTAWFPGRDAFGEDLANAPAASASASYSPDQLFAAPCAGEEAKILAKHILRPQRVTVFSGRTRAEESWLKTTAQMGLVSVEDKLDVALHAEEENLL